MGTGSLRRLAVKPHDLLPGGVRKASQDARLRHRGITPVFQNSAHRNAFVPEGAQQKFPRFVLAHDSDRQHIDAEVGKVVDRVRSAARHNFSVAMFQDKHGRFA